MGRFIHGRVREDWDLGKGKREGLGVSEEQTRADRVFEPSDTSPSVSVFPYPQEEGSGGGGDPRSSTPKGTE